MPPVDSNLAQTSQPEIPYGDALTQLHLYGRYAHVSNELLHTNRLEDAQRIACQFMCGLGVCGYFQFSHVERLVVTQRFGERAPHAVAAATDTIRQFMWGDEKICVSHDCILVKAEHVMLFVSTKGQELSVIYALQDILALFIDSLSSWVETYLMKEGLKDDLQQSLQDTIKASEELIDKYMEASEEMAFGIASFFPILGLDADQENLILDVIEHASARQVNLLEYEIQRNSKIGDALIMAVAKLNQVSLKPSDDHGSSAAVELF